MTHPETMPWSGFAASVPGAGHIRYEIPCQDASAVILQPRPALIVCDGRGSAARSHLGATGAVNAFRFQLSVLEPFLANVLDAEAGNKESWDKFCRIMYRALAQVKIDLAAEHGVGEKEFDFTVVYAIAGAHHIGCFQVGDGALVLRQDRTCVTAFAPEKGEFANMTTFLRSGGEESGRFQANLFPARVNTGIAAVSDGPQYLMFNLADMTPGEAFTQMFNDLEKGELTRQDILNHLTRPAWAKDPRGTDDRSLAILAPAKQTDANTAALANIGQTTKRQTPIANAALDAAKHAPKEAAKGDPKETPMHAPKEAPKESPKEAQKEVPPHAPKAPTDLPGDTPKNAQSDQQACVEATDSDKDAEQSPKRLIVFTVIGFAIAVLLQAAVLGACLRAHSKSLAGLLRTQNAQQLELVAEQADQRRQQDEQGQLRKDVAEKGRDIDALKTGQRQVNDRLAQLDKTIDKLTRQSRAMPTGFQGQPAPAQARQSENHVNQINNPTDRQEAP